ncbi:hypothetical protein [Candidatus Arthromitus sp. SFB-turkey]|uniref:hypothetical protein n=1 Tax=Candidatus Arthromitus sp. SFB-turkey TaxID=1840217 RepID=UPI0007F3BA16|nr:hypothetical protein [Candidatus Arthromitus sp. SFB-turkey]OAT87233.1 hypothetical protein A6P36_01185 [Candidatus Arthromitus sp. SFB-turkey]
MKLNDNDKSAVIAAASAIGIASVATIAGIISRRLKKNLVKDLNDSEFGNFNGYGKCCSHSHCSNDSYDEVLKHRKNRFYKKMRMN